jgi:glutathione reductase (NADPH)
MVPALSTVGLTEEEAAEAGLDVKILTSDTHDWFSSKSHAETVAWAKVLVDEKADKIVAAHMVGTMARGQTTRSPWPCGTAYRPAH